MDVSNKFEYQCTNCGAFYSGQTIQYLCPKCAVHNQPDAPPKGVLKVIYNYSGIKLFPGFEHTTNICQKYLSLLPINTVNSLPYLRLGQTPIYHVAANKNGKLFFKDESQNPTYSFKDRASAMVSAYAKEHNIDTIVTASTGNAGSSIAGICAAQRQKAIVLVPAGAPEAKLIQIKMYGATIIPVDGTYDLAFDLSVKLSEETGWYNRNTAFNPVTIEGKKTVAFEIFEDFKGQLPDNIFVPVGDGVILSGIFKGFEDLLLSGLIDKMPRITVVQAAKSNNIIRNIHAEKLVFSDACSVADSINVTYPRNYYMAVDYIKKYQANAIEVTDEEILNASLNLSRNYGLFAEPASAAAYAGYLKECNIKPAYATNLVILTGSGMKDLASVRKVLPANQPVEGTISALKKVLNI